MAGQPGLVCYHYTNNYDNCGYFIEDQLNGRVYIDYVNLVEPQTLQTLDGDQLDLVSRIQIDYKER